MVGDAGEKLLRRFGGSDVHVPVGLHGVCIDHLEASAPESGLWRRVSAPPPVQGVSYLYGGSSDGIEGISLSHRGGTEDDDDARRLTLRWAYT